MKKIKLTQGKWTLVSDEDYEFLNQWKWYAKKCHSNIFYAVRSKQINEKQVRLKMHNIIAERMGIKNPDHVDMDGLNNQRNNLREATVSQQGANQSLQSNNISGYKGVSWYKRYKKWLAQIRINKRKTHLGYFIDIKNAARAYNKAAIKCFGTFARVNDMQNLGQTLSAALLTPEELAKHL
jgi:hypothetical protein